MEILGIELNIWLSVWLVVAVVSLIVELCTVGLVSIWITGGAIVAMILNICGAHWGVQLGAFFVVTAVLLIATRPFAKKYINNGKRSKSNYEELIGKEVRVVEKIENRFDKGKAIYNGMEWTARSIEEDEVFEENELVKVERIEGVKLIVKRIKE